MRVGHTPPKARGRAGQILHIDPETGRLGTPTAADLARMRPGRRPTGRQPVVEKFDHPTFSRGMTDTEGLLRKRARRRGPSLAEVQGSQQAILRPGGTGSDLRGGPVTPAELARLRAEDARRPRQPVTPPPRATRTSSPPQQPPPRPRGPLPVIDTRDRPRPGVGPVKGRPVIETRDTRDRPRGPINGAGPLSTPIPRPRLFPPSEEVRYTKEEVKDKDGNVIGVGWKRHPPLPWGGMYDPNNPQPDQVPDDPYWKAHPWVKGVHGGLRGGWNENPYYDPKAVDPKDRIPQPRPFPPYQTQPRTPRPTPGPRTPRPTPRPRGPIEQAKMGPRRPPGRRPGGDFPSTADLWNYKNNPDVNFTDTQKAKMDAILSLPSRTPRRRPVLQRS